MRSAGSRTAVVALAALLWVAGGARADADFERWRDEIAREALEQGISQATLDATLYRARPVPVVLELDREQPRAPQDFCGYMAQRLTPTRIARGRRVLVEERALLSRITRDFGVPARYVVALWGLETNFGDYMGEHALMDALVTLARNPRRGDLFRSQIFAALQIVEQGDHPAEDFVGSWAGATGQVQFMPTTFLAYAVDYDGDGRKDIWESLPDALASAASYLRRSGWRSGETWGRQVRLPAGLDPAGRKSVGSWQRLGVRRVSGADLPLSDLRADVVRPMRAADPAFLVYRNYHTFLAWNRSTFFAISVGTLADQLTGVGDLRICGG